MITIDEVLEKCSKLGVEYKDSIYNEKRQKQVIYYCPIHNKTRISSEYNFVRKQKSCACNLKMYTQEDFVKFLENDTIELVGEYKNDTDKTTFRCKKCGHIWDASPNKIKQGRRCPLCKWNTLHDYFIKSTEQFKEEVSKINPLIEITGEYIGAQKNIEYKCKKCGRISISRPDRILRLGSSCHYCNMSIGEQFIEIFLEEHNIKYECQKKFADCKNINCLPFDFYIPDYNLCIEFQGEQHFMPVDFSYTPTEESKKRAIEIFEKVQFRDKIKREYCENNNINLLYISYKEKKKVPEILSKYFKL